MKFTNLLLFSICFYGLVKFDNLEAQELSPLRADDALLEAYKNSQVLAIAAGNHSTYWKFDLAEKLLDEVKNDKNLKYIILESSNELAPKMQQASLPSLSYLDVFNETDKPLRDFLCSSNEFAYGLGSLLKKVRSINLSREQDPILLTAIDGVNINRNPYWPLSDFNFDLRHFDLNTTECSPVPMIEILNPIYVSSANREDDTANNFLDLFMSLKPEEKVIIIYHTAHLVPTIHSCMAAMDEQSVSQWTNSLSPLSWYQRAVEASPSLRSKTKLVLLDEKDTQYSIHGNFKFLSQYATSLSLDSRVVIKGEDLDRYSSFTKGYDILQQSSFLINYMGQGDRDNFSHKDLFDYYIWEKASEKFQFPPSKESFPEVCGA